MALERPGDSGREDDWHLRAASSLGSRVQRLVEPGSRLRSTKRAHGREGILCPYIQVERPRQCSTPRALS